LALKAAIAAAPVGEGLEIFGGSSEPFPNDRQAVAGFIADFPDDTVEEGATSPCSADETSPSRSETF